jgi:hypothetical protein
VIAIQRAQLARLAGSPQAALDAAMEAARVSAAVPPDRTVTIDLRALQARNALALPENSTTRPIKAHSESFLHEHIKRGYAFLKSFAVSAKALGD